MKEAIVRKKDAHKEMCKSGTEKERYTRGNGESSL